MAHISRIQSISVRPSGPRRSGEHASAAALPHDRIYWLCVGLAVSALALLVYYVAQVNVLASRSWEMRVLQDQLVQIHQQRDDIVSRQGELDDRIALEQLAAGQGLVPAGSVVYVFQDGSVAAR